MPGLGRGFTNGGGPPRLNEVPGRVALTDFVRGRAADLRVSYRRGGETVEEKFDHIDTSRGAELAELHYPDGRYCTVNVAREVEAVGVAE